jgi:hypothetical protein
MRLRRRLRPCRCTHRFPSGLAFVQNQSHFRGLPLHGRRRSFHRRRPCAYPVALSAVPRIADRRLLPARRRVFRTSFVVRPHAHPSQHWRSYPTTLPKAGPDSANPGSIRLLTLSSNRHIPVSSGLRPRRCNWRKSLKHVQPAPHGAQTAAGGRSTLPKTQQHSLRYQIGQLLIGAFHCSTYIHVISVRRVLLFQRGNG